MVALLLVLPMVSAQILIEGNNVDENRTFVANVTANVSEYDGLTATIPVGDYLEAKFDIQVDSTRDMWVVATVDNASEPALVELYEEDNE